MKYPKLISILNDTDHNLNLFNEEEIINLEKKITIKDKKYFVKCIIRDKEIILKPEEIVRQLYTHRLINTYKYKKKAIIFEKSVQFGRETKSADIVICDSNKSDVEYIIVELKKPKLKDGKDQLKSYCNATGAPIGVWTNGSQISHYHRKDPNYFEDISRIPNSDETLEDVLQSKFTWKDLLIRDKVPNEGKSLKTIITDMEDEVLANSGVDVFEEVFKLIFAKLYDESKSKDDRVFIDRIINRKKETLELNNLEKLKEQLQNIDDEDFRIMEFRNTGQSDSQLKTKIQKLFNEANSKWNGVFSEGAKIELTASHLSVCVSSIQDVKLFNSNLQIIDEAFEYLVNKSAKGEKGQYFTPRHVIDMCVKMLNPKKGEYMIDTAAGSCGFTVHTIFWLTKHLFENKEISNEDKDSITKIFGIDFDEKVVRVARTLNLIAGDGETNVLHLNTLDYQRWNENVSDRKWYSTYGKGFERLEKLCSEKNSFQKFNFDILMANPPFAGDIKESRILHKYEIAYDKKNKPKKKLGRDILFVERNLDFVKPGGRLAIVLPQGRFNNISDKEIRSYISDRARILAVIGLHTYTFKPHTTPKVSIIFLQKWDEKLNPKKDDYPIFFGISEKSGKDSSGEYVYLKDENKFPILDKHGHFIVNSDLHNHNGENEDGIAENFIAWAKKEKLDFWK